jgi:hypothetical protein
MTELATSARFELVGLGNGAASELFGLWAGTDDIADLSFAADADQNITCWRVRLPADADQASTILADAGERLRVADAALSDADRRLAAIARAPIAAPPAQPEANLVALIGSSGHPVIGSSGHPPDAEVAFGIVPDRWLDAARGFSAFATQQLKSATGHARIETYVGGLLAGSSVLGFAGRLDTALATPLDPERAQLHQRTVALTILTRTAFIRVTVIVVRGATILSTAMTSPVGPVLALPAAWKFVEDVLGEARWLKTEWQAVEHGTRSS